MPKANPDYAGITQAAKDLAAREAAESSPFTPEAQMLDMESSLSGNALITWSTSTTKAYTRHTKADPTAVPEVTHIARFDVRPMAMDTVRLEYGTVTFWPDHLEITWVDGKVTAVYLEGQQATKAGQGEDRRRRKYRIAEETRYGATALADLPILIRDTIAHYETKVPVASPSPMVVE